MRCFVRSTCSSQDGLLKINLNKSLPNKADPYADHLKELNVASRFDNEAHDLQGFQE